MSSKERRGRGGQRKERVAMATSSLELVDMCEEVMGICVVAA